MPIFEFRCEDCGKLFETLAKRDETVECPDCKSKNTKKQLSKFGFASGAGFRSSVGSGDCGSCSSTSCAPT